MLKVTSKFMDKLIEQPIAVRELLRIEIAELRSHRESGFVSHANSYSKIKSISGKLSTQSKKSGIALKEWKINDSARIIFDDSPDIGLIHFDMNHNAIEQLERLKNQELNNLIGSFTESPDWLLNASSELALKDVIYSEGKDRETFVEEMFNEWNRFLDHPQSELADKLFDLLTANPSSEPILDLIIGGAGTGKTTVLLEVAWRLKFIAEKEFAFQIPRGVAEMFRRTEPSKWFEISADAGPILLDDPLQPDELIQKWSKARVRGRSLVCAIDPTQWSDKRTREKFAGLLASGSVRKHHLNLAYRQGGQIGKGNVALMSNFLSRSSMYAASESVAIDLKRGSEWEKECLENVSFRDEAGSFVFFDIKNEYDSKELNWDKTIASFKNLLADQFSKISSFKTERSWPKLLIGSYSSKLLPAGLTEVIAEAQDLDQDLIYQRKAFQDQADIRGTEFESVIIFVTQDDWKNMAQGKTGLNNKTWPQIMEPFTFMTRAENRLVVFALPSRYPIENRQGQHVDGYFYQTSPAPSEKRLGL